MIKNRNLYGLFFTLRGHYNREAFLHRVPRITKKGFLFSAQLPFFAHGDWYLAGGTALALQVGHRKSVDLDFFTTRPKFDEGEIEQELMNTKEWVTTLRRKGTLYGTLLKAKMSLIAYPFFRPAAKRIRYGMVTILTPADIAAMKIIAVSQRGRKRDFVDLYWYCTHLESPAKVVARAIKQYPGQEQNLNHILKSLIYFDDAESDPMPELFF